MSGGPLRLSKRLQGHSICLQCILRLQRPAVPPPWLTASFTTTRTTRRRVRGSKVGRTENEGPTSAQVQQLLRNLDKTDELPGKADGNHSFDLNYFEEDERGRRPLAGDKEFSQSLSGTGDPSAEEKEEEWKEIMGEFGHHFGDSTERQAFEDAMRETDIDWLKVEQDPAEAWRAKEKLEAHGAKIDAEIDELSKELDPGMRKQIEAEMAPLLESIEGDDDDASILARSSEYPQIPETAWTANQRRKIKRMNSVMRHTGQHLKRTRKITSKAITNLYKAYHSARMTLSAAWETVPLDVWDFLWTILCADKSVNPNRFQHATLLSRDMSEAQVEFTPAQQLLTIEALHRDGWEARALDSWKRCISTLGNAKSETFSGFWNLGVELHSQNGDLEQAEKALNELLKRGTDPRCMLPLIRACCTRGRDYHQKAWDMYRSMREKLGTSIRIADYDEVISYFLTTGQTENALHAFVDMMSEGEIDLKKGRYLPSVVANKFFVGKWLKRLIGAGDLEGAHTVIDFMRQKGVEAAPIHVNGLIAALQRKGGADDTEKANALAWSMIESRIEFVKARQHGVTSNALVDRGAGRTASLPRATLETFCILAENYRSRNLHEPLLELWDAFGEAKMTADAFMVNQLLESYIQGSQWGEARTLYNTLITKKGIKPDPYTFSALWKTLGINRLHLSAAQDFEREARACRELFATMIEARDVFQGEMDGQLARKILHTFRRVEDPIGVVLALRTLKNQFGFLPPEVLVLEMVIGTTKLSWDSATDRKHLMKTKREIDVEMLKWADGDYDKLTEADRDTALYDFLERKYSGLVEAREPAAAAVQAAEQMGVHKLLGLEQAPV